MRPKPEGQQPAAWIRKRAGRRGSSEPVLFDKPRMRGQLRHFIQFLTHHLIFGLRRHGSPQRGQCRADKPVFAARVFDSLLPIRLRCQPKKTACNQGTSPSGVDSDSNFAARPRPLRRRGQRRSPTLTRMAYPVPARHPGAPFPMPPAGDGMAP